MQYKFLNVNPLSLREKDCVCRAIKAALDLDYYYVLEKLNQVADLFECDTLCVCCYKFLLDSVFCLKRIEEYHGETIESFVNMHPTGTYIIRVQGHLTHCKDGVLLDTWDCRDEIVDIVWEV